jgi:hypothetical protein
MIFLLAGLYGIQNLARKNVSDATAGSAYFSLPTEPLNHKGQIAFICLTDICHRWRAPANGQP